MQKSMITLSILLSFVLCAQAQDVKDSSNEESYLVNPFQSVVKWKGSYAFKFSEHNGTVEIFKGKLYTTNGAISGGFFTIDMTSISNEDYLLDRGPVAHLKNSDFFDVEVYPEASFHITKATYFSDTNEHRLEGDLTIKDISHPIMIMAKIDGTKKTLKTRFKIDRNDWGINYQSKFKDGTISDAIEFDVFLQF